LDVTLPSGAFLLRVQSFINNMVAAAPIMQKGIHDIVAAWESTEALAEDVKLVEKLQAIFDLLDFAKVIEELEVKKATAKGEYRTAFSNVVVKFFDDLVTNTPFIIQGLQTVDLLWKGAWTSALSIAKNIQDVFGAIGDAIGSAADIMEIEDWNIAKLLNKISDLQVAMLKISGLTWGTPNLVSPTLDMLINGPTSTPVPGTDSSTIIRDSIVEGMRIASEERDAAMLAAMREGIIQGIRGTELQVLLDVQQDPASRQRFTQELGEIKRITQRIVIRLDAAGI